MVVGEAPGQEEDKSGIPFIGQSGKLLRTVLSEAGATQDRIFITNAVRCRPPMNRTPHEDELQECRFWLDEDTQAVQPFVVLALGKSAQKQVEGLSYQLADGMPLHPTIINAFHPAYILRNPKKRAAWEADIRRAVELAGLLTESGLTHVVGSDPAATHSPTPLQPWTWDEPDFSSPWLACDTETKDLQESIHFWLEDGLHTVSTGERGVRMVCFQLSDGERASLYLHPARLPSAAEHVWLHNAKYDLPLLGIDPYDFDAWQDTMLIAYLLREDRVGLKILGPKYTGIPMTSIKTILTGTRKEPVMLKSGRQATAYGEPKFKTVKWERTFDQALNEDPEAATEYALKDAVVTSRLAQVLMPKLEANPRLLAYYHEIEKPTVPILLKMEQRGVLVSEERLVALGQALDHDMTEAELHFHRTAGFETNIRSARQIATALKDSGIALTRRTPTGEIAVDEATLLAAAESVGCKLFDGEVTHPIIRPLLEYRDIVKQKKTYVDNLLAARDNDGRIHARFNQAATDTGRLSSSDPNLQNLPARESNAARIRRAFIAPHGYKLVKADFSQLQIRIYTDYTQERVLLDAYCGTPERDVYQAIADELEITRFQAKNGVLLPKLFGASDQKVSTSIGLPQSQVGLFTKRLVERIPSLSSKGWATQITRYLEDHGHVETRLGRRQEYPLFDSPIGRERAEAIRQAQCYPIQGTEAEIVKLWLIEVDRTIRAMPWGRDVHLVLQVHDEGVWECPDEFVGDLAVLLSTEAGAIGFRVLDTVPLKVEVSAGPNWGETGPVGKHQ